MLKQKKINFDANYFFYKNLKLLYKIFLFFFPFKVRKNTISSHPRILYVHREWGIDTGIINYTKFSLRNYCQENNFQCIILENNSDFFGYLKKNILKFEIDVIVFDVRVMLVSAYWYQIPGILVKSRLIANLCAKNNIKIICQSTDFFQFSDRIISALLTSNHGSVLSLATLPEIKNYPHNRVIGPCPAIIDIKVLKNRSQLKLNKDIDVFIGGLLYGIREKFYSSLHEILINEGIKSVFIPKKDLKSYNEYLDVLSRSKIVVTTNFFSNDPTKIQMNGKCVEAPLMGALLLAQESPTLNHFFKNGEEYIGFTDLNDPKKLLNTIKDLLNNTDLMKKITKAGNEKVLSFINSNKVWEQAILL